MKPSGCDSRAAEFSQQPQASLAWEQGNLLPRPRDRCISRWPVGAPPCLGLDRFGRIIDRRRAGEAGFSEYLAKPVDPAQSLTIVADLVERA
jgi:CheY-like chemotaxis protein